MEKAFGIDVSRYDGFLRWDAVDAHIPRVTFIAFRCTISWAYRDPFFAANWAEAGKRGYNRMAYHVVYPNEDATKQADNFFTHLGKYDEHDRFVLDVEVEHDASLLKYTKTVSDIAQIFERNTGMLPILYSRAEFIQRRLLFRNLPKMHLWLAQYLKPKPGSIYADEHPGPPVLPKGASTWLIHQTGKDCRAFCASTDKKYQDYNRWNGDEKAVNEYFGRVKESKPTIEERIEDLEKRIAKIESIIEGKQ